MKSFLALLVFLYTDTLPGDMTVSDYRELLVLADRFCLSQLISVCEGAISEKINAELKKQQLNSAKCNDIINLLLTGQVKLTIGLCYTQGTVCCGSNFSLVSKLFKPVQFLVSFVSNNDCYYFFGAN